MIPFLSEFVDALGDYCVFAAGGEEYIGLLRFVSGRREIDEGSEKQLPINHLDLLLLIVWTWKQL